MNHYAQMVNDLSNTTPAYTMYRFVLFYYLVVTLVY